MRQTALLLTALLTFFNVRSQSFTIDSMKRIIRATSSVDTNKVQLYLQLSKEWARINIDSALRYSEKSYQLSSNLKYINGQAEAKLIQAKLNSDLGQYSKAYEFYLNAFDSYALLNSQAGLASVYHGLATTYERQQDYGKALNYLSEALLIYEKSKLRDDIAKTLIQIGSIHFKTGNTSSALSQFEKALQLANSIRNKIVAADAHNAIGNVYSSMGLHKKALAALVKSRNMGLLLNDPVTIAQSNLNIGIAYRELNQHDSSLFNLNAALAYFTEQKNTEGISNTYQALGKIYIDLKQFEKAKEMLAASNMLAAKANDNQQLFDNYNMLLYISKSEADHATALQLYEKLLALKDDLFNDEKAGSIERVKAGYELERKQETINELQKENSLKTTQRNTLFIAFGITALSMILLWISIVQIKRKRKLLIEQKAALELQTKKLEELNVVKDKFFSILSHDLRSPMVNILGLLNIVSTDKNISENDKAMMFDGLKSSTTSTLETMDNILAWGRQQIKDNKSEIEQVNIHEIADRVCRFLQQSADKKSIKIINQINSDVHIMADNNRLEFVLRNLMSNALKFSHNNSKVEIWTSVDESFVNIHVKDFGTGIKKEMQEKLFDVQKTKSSRGTAGEIGTGLGLILSQEFINENNGSLSVTSEPGEGTTFTIRHPWSLS